MRVPIIGSAVLTQDMPRMQIGPDQYFAMGDNRMYSYDSRAFGPIGKDKIVGRVSCSELGPVDDSQCIRRL
jgi:signal peptidase I